LRLALAATPYLPSFVSPAWVVTFFLTFNLDQFLRGRFLYSSHHQSIVSILTQLNHVQHDGMILWSMIVNSCPIIWCFYHNPFPICMDRLAQFLQCGFKLGCLRKSYLTVFRFIWSDFWIFFDLKQLVLFKYDPVELGELRSEFLNNIQFQIINDDRDNAFVILEGVLDLIFTNRRADWIFADYEHEDIGIFDCLEDFIPPTFTYRDTFPIDPGVYLTLLEGFLSNLAKAISFLE